VAGDELSLVSTAAVTSVGKKETLQIEEIKRDKEKLAEAIISCQNA